MKSHGRALFLVVAQLVTELLARRTAPRSLAAARRRRRRVAHALARPTSRAVAGLRTVKRGRGRHKNMSAQNARNRTSSGSPQVHVCVCLGRGSARERWVGARRSHARSSSRDRSALPRDDRRGRARRETMTAIRVRFSFQRALRFVCPRRRSKNTRSSPSPPGGPLTREKSGDVAEMRCPLCVRRTPGWPPRTTRGSAWRSTRPRGCRRAGPRRGRARAHWRLARSWGIEWVQLAGLHGEARAEPALSGRCAPSCGRSRRFRSRRPRETPRGATGLRQRRGRGGAMIAVLVTKDGTAARPAPRAVGSRARPRGAGARDAARAATPRESAEADTRERGAAASSRDARARRREDGARARGAPRAQNRWARARARARMRSGRRGGRGAARGRRGDRAPGGERASGAARGESAGRHLGRGERGPVSGDGLHRARVLPRVGCARESSPVGAVDRRRGRRGAVVRRDAVSPGGGPIPATRNTARSHREDTPQLSARTDPSSWVGVGEV